MATQQQAPAFALHPRMLGAAAPLFPGFEIDICEPIPEDAKPDAIWHRGRAKAMLCAHPELRELMGTNPTTAAWCLAFSAGQVAVACGLATQPLWLIALAAWTFGAWANINLFMLAHECDHHLVFRSRRWNRWLFTITSLPMMLPLHHTWWIDHPVHHSDLGSKKDFITRRRRFFLATRLASPLIVPFGPFMLFTQTLRAVVGLLLYVGGLSLGRTRPGPLTLSVLAEDHLRSAYRRKGLETWAVVYPMLAVGLYAAVLWFAGWRSVAYLFFSASFMTGFLHPLLLGMILSNSHFTGHARYQPSASYYGWLNRFTFNFGLHTEHHDLARVPWNRLPEVRRLAPEFYDGLLNVGSYTALAAKFVFGGRATHAMLFDNDNHRHIEPRPAARSGAAVAPPPVVPPSPVAPPSPPSEGRTQRQAAAAIPGL